MQDDILAYRWLSLAARAGDESAEALRDRVAARMTREQIAHAEAQERAGAGDPGRERIRGSAGCAGSAARVPVE